jgi:hypothetical protein
MRRMWQIWFRGGSTYLRFSDGSAAGLTESVIREDAVQAAGASVNLAIAEDNSWATVEFCWVT